MQQADKWGMFDVDGNMILPLEYDEMGCLLGTQASEIGNNVIVIPQYEAIVVGQEEKYCIINSTGDQYVPMILDSVYSQTVSGEVKYYMTFTWPLEETGEITPTQYTYDVDEYFEQQVIETPQTPIDQNTIVSPTVNTVDTNTLVDGNEISGNEVDTNIVATNTIETNSENTNATDTNSVA